MEYLKGDSISPPLNSGAVGSPRRIILESVENALLSTPTAVRESALIIFGDVDDPAMKTKARQADFSLLKAAPWLLCGSSTWCKLFTSGLNPDDARQSAEDWSTKPDYPVASPQAKAGLLPWTISEVKSFTLDLPYNIPFGFNNYLRVGHGLKDFWGTFYNRAGDSQSISLRIEVVEEVLADFNLSIPRSTLLEHDSVARDIGFEGVSAEGFIDKQFYPKYPNNNRFDYQRVQMLVQFVINRAWERRALLLYGLQIARQHGFEVTPPNAVNVDGYFDDFVEKQKSYLKIITSQVSAFSNPWTIGFPVVPQNCVAKSENILSREIRFSDWTFQEKFLRSCEDGNTYPVIYSGYLPAWSIGLLRRHIRYLDLTEITLSSLSYPTVPASELSRDISLVEASPIAAAEAIMAGLWNPAIPWTEIREVPLLAKGSDLDWLVNNVIPVDNHNGHVSGSNDIAMSSSEYEKNRESLSGFVISDLKLEGDLRVINGMGAILDNLDPEQTRQISCGANCFQVVKSRDLKYSLNNSRNAAVQQYNTRLKARGERLFHNDQCLNGSLDDRYVFNMISQDYTQYASWYGFNDAKTESWCNYFVESALTLDASVLSALKMALAQDQHFLSRYGIDLAPTGSGVSGRLQTALGNAISAEQRYSWGTQQLYLAGVSEWFASASQFLPNARQRMESGPLEIFGNGEYWGGGFPLLLDGPTPPEARSEDVPPDWTLPVDLLANSEDGIIYASAISLAQRVHRETRSAEVLAIPNSLSRETAGKLHDSYELLRQLVYQQADSQISAIQNAVNAFKNQGGWFIGVSIADVFGVASGGIQFSVGGRTWGAGLSGSLPTLQIPTWNGFSVPVSLPLTSDALGPQASQQIARPGADTAEQVSTVAATLRVPADTAKRDLASKILTAVDDGSGGGTISSGVGMPATNQDWAILLARNNGVGRTWLNGQITIASPSLTADQLAQISAGLKLPSFPVELAKVIAAKAREMSPPDTVPLGGSLTNQSAEETCHNASWSNCSIAIKQELHKNLSDPVKLLNIELAWSNVYDSRYEVLRKGGHLEKATPDAERITESVRSALSPLDIAKDHAENAVIEKCLGRFGFLLKWANNPVLTGVKNLFHPVDTATDFDELDRVNNSIQEEIGRQLQPFMVPNWQFQLQTAVNKASPQWSRP